MAKKGYDDLLAALGRLPAEVNWRFIHIGGGPLKDALARHATQLGLSDRVEWRGKRDQTEVIAALRAADVFVLPSKIAGDGDRDGLPNVLMEAASQRVAIVSTTVSAIPEFIGNGLEGLLVPPDAPDALAKGLAEVIGDVAIRTSMAGAAYDRLTREFGMERGIDMLEELLRTALSQPPAAQVA